MKTIITIFIILFVTVLGFLIAIGYIFGAFDKDYSVPELIENYKRNKDNVSELKRYFNEIVPKNRFVEIEFENDSTLTRFGIKPLDSTAGDIHGKMYLEWDVNINNNKTDSIIKSMGWTKQTLKTLKQKLDNANCISIESGEPTTIGFQRSGMVKYSFIVFDNPMPDSTKELYDNSVSLIVVNDKFVLQYGGGAIGPNGFYEKEKLLKEKSEKEFQKQLKDLKIRNTK